jgi:hypothetical protein
MNKRIKYVSMLMLIVMGIICFPFGSSTPQSARAHHGSSDGADFLVWQRHFGIVPEQMMRVTVANPGENREPPPLFFLCKVLDQNGNLVFQTPSREVQPRGFQYEDIMFGDLAVLIAEPATGRKQMSLRVEVRTARGPGSSNVGGTLEVIDSDTGKTIIYDPTFGDSLVSGFQNSSSR